MKRTASPAQADRGGIRGVVMRPWGSGSFAAVDGRGWLCVRGGSRGHMKVCLEVLSIQYGHLTEKIWRSTPDFQDLTEAKVFQTFGEDKSGSVKWPYCMVRTSSGRE